MFRDRLLRNVFLASLLVVLALPAYSLLVDHPSFTRLLIDITEDEADWLGQHLRTELLEDVDRLEDVDINSAIFQHQADSLVRDLQKTLLDAFLLRKMSYQINWLRALC